MLQNVFALHNICEKADADAAVMFGQGQHILERLGTWLTRGVRGATSKKIARLEAQPFQPGDSRVIFVAKTMAAILVCSEDAKPVWIEIDEPVDGQPGRDLLDMVQEAASDQRRVSFRLFPSGISDSESVW